MTVVTSGQITITDINDAVSVQLSNEFCGVPAEDDGSGADFTGCATTVTVTQGVTDITSNGWTVTATPSAGLTGSLSGRTYTVTGLDSSTGYVDLVVNHTSGSTLSKRFTVTKVRRGEAGAVITLVPTGQGFFFKDGAPDPAGQMIGFMVVRQNTDAPVTFEASDGVPLLTDAGYMEASQYHEGLYGQGVGDICYLSVADFGMRQQVTVTAKAGSLASAVTILRLDQSSAEAGATRNVFRGELVNGQAYLVGDTVISGGYGWACIQAHFSDATNRPPAYPATQNTWWALASVKGADTINAVVSNEAFVFPAGSNGAVSAYAGSGTVIRVYEGAQALDYDGVGTSPGTWKVTTAATNITVGSLSDSGSHLTVGDHSGVANGTDTASITYTITGKSLAGVDFTMLKTQTFTKSRQGVDGTIGYSAVSALLSNEVHVLPAASDGTVSSYTNSGTEVRVYEGATELLYDGVGTSNGTWKVTTAVTNITCGTLTDSGTFLTVGQHSGVAAGTDTSSIVYTITGKSSAGTPFTITKNQTFTKSKAGATGATGAQGPSVLVTSDRATTFTATDGTLDASQANIVFTASVSGVASPTYVWSFSGFQTAPTNSGAVTQTITAAQFGTAKSAIVTCTVSGTYTDKVTIVRLETSTAAAGATVGATIGTNLGGQIDLSNVSTYIANGAIGSAQIGSVALVGTANFSVKTSASGARMEMDSRAIKVFDASGVLRVQLGDLSV